MRLYADLLLRGSPVYTADTGHPWAEAVAVRGRRILAVGRTSDLAELQGPGTRVVELQGGLLLPGFTDSHIHFVETALRATEVDLTAVPSAGAAAEKIRAALSTARDFTSRWIRGGGWDANLWTDGVAPHRSLLDAVAPETPILLHSKDLHSAWVNSAALRHAGLTATTADIAGGVIERDANGEPTGVLREKAVLLVERCIPAPDLTEAVAAARALIPALWAAGIVAIHNANDTQDGLALRACQVLRQQESPGIRVLQHIPVAGLPHARALGLRSGFGDEWLRIGGVKIFADGSLGSRTASMIEPYTRQPDSRGVLTTEPDELLGQVLAATAAGLHVAIHAIGDRANREALNALAEARRRGTDPALRHRIEHVQCLHPDDLPRLQQLNVIASVQPIHATSDMLMVEEQWGPERARHSYPFRSLLDRGTRLVFGSDSPVEPFAPLSGIHAAVTRRRSDGSPGPDGWQGQERITVAEAVQCYTLWPAYAAGEERYRGSITPGKAADLVALSRNIFAMEPMEILDTEVALTVLDGRIVWQGG